MGSAIRPPHRSMADPKQGPRLLPLAGAASPERPEPSILTRADLESDIPLPLGLTDIPPEAAAASSDLRRFLFGGRKRRRHAGLPLPIDPATTLLDRNFCTLSYVILEDIVHYTLSTLHNIQKSLLYWESIAEGTNLQRMYFMVFERGPRAFLETTWQTLTGLRSTSPSQYLLNSAANMVSIKLDALASMQDCLAAFLAEVYSEVDKWKGRLNEYPNQSLHALAVMLNPLFSKLELSLRTLAEAQPSSFTQLSFQTLPEGCVHISTVVKLIYQNLLMFDRFISNKLAVHQKPRNKTIYWLPYTCGAIGLSACSLWLLRHSSFMGSSDLDGSIYATKESLAGYWDQHAVELIISIRDGLYRTFKRTNKLISTEQVVHQIEASLHRCEKEVMHLPQKLPSGEFTLAMPTNKIQNHAHDLQKKLLELDCSVKEKKLSQQEALLELNRILEGNEIKFALCAAWPAFGVCLLLLLLLRASFFHDQDEEERSKMSRLPQRLLLRDAELRFMEFQKCMTRGMEKKAGSKFGLILCDLDRLYKAVEFHAKKTGEWSSQTRHCGPSKASYADVRQAGCSFTSEGDVLLLTAIAIAIEVLSSTAVNFLSPSICYPPSR